MSARILLFDPVERFVAGTVGQPGERTFFLQARQGNRLISVSLDKSQVQALAERLLIMVREIKQSAPTMIVNRLPKDDGPLDTPIEEEFRIGAIGLAFDSVRELIQIDLQAISEEDEQEFVEVDNLSIDRDLLRVMISPSLAQHFANRAQTVVSAGRAPCPFCGGPLDIRGHLCPRANGYRR